MRDHRNGDLVRPQLRLLTRPDYACRNRLSTPLDTGATPVTSTMKNLKTSHGDVAKLSPPKAAYIAGLIDGEGTVALTRHNNNEYRRLEICIGNSELPMLQWVQDTARAGRIKKKRPLKEGYRMMYTYAIYNRQAFNLLLQVVRYLKTYKQKRAKMILQNYERLTPRNGKYSPSTLLQRKEFIREFFEIPKV